MARPRSEVMRRSLDSLITPPLKRTVPADVDWLGPPPRIAAAGGEVEADRPPPPSDEAAVSRPRAATVMLQEAMEDEFEALKPAGVGPEMERWNVEDLQAYIDSMKAEIARVETILASKSSVTEAAAALFGDKS